MLPRPLPLVAAVLLAGACRADPGRVEDIEHVVVLVIDGVRMDESFGEGSSSAAGLATSDLLPRIRREVLPNGALVAPAWNTGLTITAPAHCALLTGTRQPIDNYPSVNGLGRYVPDLPTLFELLSASGRGRGALIGNTDIVRPAGESAWPGLGAKAGADWVYLADKKDPTTPGDDDGAVLDATWRALAREDRPLIVANLHAMDRAGHFGEEGEYVQRILDVDAPLAHFYNRLQADAALRASTLLVVLADHGRHAGTGAVEEWREHGDACAGCRSIPMFVAGPGVRRGVVVDADHTLEDVSATLAWVLHTPLPFAQGAAMTELFTGSPEAPAGPRGTMDADLSGGIAATSTWVRGAPPAASVAGTETGPVDSATGADLVRARTSLRSAVSVDGVRVSDPDAVRAEAPVVVATTQAAAVCWRELRLDREASRIPWRGRCRYRALGGSWEDISPPLDEVSPLWAPALALDGHGGLWLAASTNVLGAVSERADDDYVRLYRYSPATGWVLPKVELDGVQFVTGLSMEVGGGRALVALSTSDPADPDGRNTRHVPLYAVDDVGWTLLADGLMGTDDAGGTWDRRESPALRVYGERWDLATLGYGQTGTTILTSSSSDEGATWSPPHRLDATGRVLTSIPPRWAQGALWWARLSAYDKVELCRWEVAVGDTRCVETNAPRAYRMSPDGGGAWATVDVGEGSWELRYFPLP